jgi:hypothetical protein
MRDPVPKKQGCLFLAGNNSGISIFLDLGRTLLRQKYSQSGTKFPKLD